MPQNEYPNVSSNPAGDVRPATEQRADKGTNKTGLYALVIAVVVIGVALVVLDRTAPGEDNRQQHPGGPQQTEQLNR